MSVQFSSESFSAQGGRLSSTQCSRSVQCSQCRINSCVCTHAHRRARTSSVHVPYMCHVHAHMCVSCMHTDMRPVCTRMDARTHGCTDRRTYGRKGTWAHGHIITKRAYLLDSLFKIGCLLPVAERLVPAVVAKMHPDFLDETVLVEHVLAVEVVESPAAWGLRPAAWGLRPAAWGLRPAAWGLRPAAWGLLGLQHGAF